MKKTIGITGASGFVGERLIEKLLIEGYPVVALLRSPKKLPTGSKVVTGDLLDSKSLHPFVDSVDTVIHLAARQLPPEDLFFQDNVVATKNLIEVMMQYQIKQMIYLSSVAVYGDQEEKIHQESDICHPTTMYGLTKYLAETLCQYWQTKTSSTVTILRPFNIYGKNSEKGVIYNMISQIKENKPIMIYGNGKQKRDFLFVDDVISAITVSLQKEKNGIYNLGSGINTSLLELVSLLKKVAPYEVTTEFKKSESGKTLSIEYSLAKAKKELGWEAKTVLKDGLRSYYE